MLENQFNPKVSIIIPVYNGANYLEQSIDSALAQTYENTEILVINDGSTDDGATERIALSYGDRIRYYSKTNGGVSSALNYGIRMMTGDYVSWLSHDDLYMPAKVADAVALLATLSEEREKTIAYTSGCYIDKNGSRIKAFPHKFTPGKRHTGREMAEYSCRKGTLYGCAMLIPKTAFEEFGGLDETLRYSQDALMWYILFFGGYGLISDENDNVRYRLHGTQVSRNRRDLFAHDSLVIAKKLAPQLQAFSADGRELLFLYAYRMAKYECSEAVAFLTAYGTEKNSFTLEQRVKLKLRLLYGKFRGRLKSIYYRFILRVRA